MICCSKNSQIPNEKEDIRSLQVNKDGCREFISGHGEMSVMRVAQVVSISNLFTILIDGTTVHGKEKEGVYIQLLLREEFMK